MRNQILTKLGKWAGEKTWTMFSVVLVLTAIFTVMSGKLEMNMSMTDLLPGDDPMVDEFNYIFEEFNGASTMFIVAEGKMEDMIDFAEAVTPKITHLEKWI